MWMNSISWKIYNNQMFQLKLNYYTNLCSKSVIVNLFYITKKIGSTIQFQSEWIPKSLDIYFSRK
jgi:hypothetical protein